jgi:hypothetical protein
MSDFIDFFRKDWIAKYYGENTLRIKLRGPGSLLEEEYDAACFLGITTKR